MPSTPDYDSRTPSLTNSDSTSSLIEGDAFSPSELITRNNARTVKGNGASAADTGRPSSWFVSKAGDPTLRLRPISTASLSPSSWRSPISASYSPSSSSASRPSSGYEFHGYAVNPKLTAILSTRRTLDRLLACLSWPDFYALSNASKAMRKTFNTKATKNAAINRFVPGFSRWRDEDNPREVQITLDHINALSRSEGTSLHIYPAHALRHMSSVRACLPITDESTQGLSSLAITHSRFVILLNSRARRARQEQHYGLPEFNYGVTESFDHLPELKFPAPLSYFSAPPAGAKPGVIPHIPKLRAKRPSTLIQKASIVFGVSPRAPPPPPKPTPPSLAQHRSRRSRAVQSIYMSAAQTRDDSSIHTLTPIVPRVRSEQRRRSLPASIPGSSTSSLSSISNPHDLASAASRFHAPIIRVYVPCSELSPAAIAVCEDQLYEAGLWGHLNVGDIIVNLGYVPNGDSDKVFDQTSDPDPSWLIYDGNGLQVFRPLRSPPPIDNSLYVLPSPTYYSHIMPPYEHPLHVISLPPSKRPVKLRLVQLTSSVPSHVGRARVNKFAWTGTFEVVDQDIGWNGEWTVEAEGTQEGKTLLQNALRGRHGYAWEVVLDKCSERRTWLKLLSESDLES